MKKKIFIQSIGTPMTGVSKTGKEYYHVEMIVKCYEQTPYGEKVEHTMAVRVTKPIDMEKLKLFITTQNPLDANLYFNVREYEDRNANLQHANQIVCYLPREFYAV